MSFSQLNLDPSIVKAIQACGYTDMTPIQARSIPDILNGSDLVASAQTGTGKTAAFVLPALHRLSLKKLDSSRGKSRSPRILILTPTRELATQITQAAGRYGKFLQFNIVSLVGGMPYRQQLRDLSRDLDIIVATPGRLLDHMDNKRLDLSGIEMLVLDEADRMLDMGFIDDVRDIAKATPNSRQTLLFSATVDSKLSQVVKHLLKNPIRIDFSNEKLAPVNIKQELYLVDNPQHRLKVFHHLLESESIFKAIIFTATKIGADKLSGQLIDQGFSAAPLHGDLKQSVRNRTLEQLRRGKLQFLVATDVAARGIDIVDMSHVINFDLPRFCEDYVHRIGRTGRAGKLGKAISFALPSDARHVQRIEKYIGNRLQLETIEGLEPKSNHINPNPPRAKGKGGKSRFGKSNYEGSEGPSANRKRSNDKFSRKRVGESSKADAAESSRGRSSYAGKSDRSESDRGRGNFAAKSDRFETKRGRSDGARGGRGDRERFTNKPSGSESSRHRSDYAGKPERSESRRDRADFSNKSDRAESSGRSYAGKSDRSESSRDRSSYAGKSDRSPRGRSSYADKTDRSEPSRERSSYARKTDRSESGRERSSYAGKSDRSETSRGRPSYANKSGRSEAGNGRSDYARKPERSESSRSRSSYAGKSDRSESSHGKSDYAPKTNRSESGRSRSGFAGKVDRSEPRGRAKFADKTPARESDPARRKPDRAKANKAESGSQKITYISKSSKKSKDGYKSKKD